MLRRGPGLVRTAGRTAAIVGTAGAVSHHQQQKYAQKDAAQNAAQEQQYAEEAPPPPPPPPQYAAAAPAPAEDSLIDQLKELAELHTAGVLSDAEFEAAKAKLLA